MLEIKEKSRLSALLRESGYKATPGRLSLLQVLGKADRPLSIEGIAKELQGRLNSATLYRALEALAEVNIVRRIDLGHGHADYELAMGQKHHHHIICKQCGKIEDVEYCDVKDIERTVLKKSKGFSVIESHSLEFIGRCKQCTR